MHVSHLSSARVLHMRSVTNDAAWRSCRPELVWGHPEYSERNELTFKPLARGNIVARSDIVVMICKEGFLSGMNPMM